MDEIIAKLIEDTTMLKMNLKQMDNVLKEFNKRISMLENENKLQQN